VSIELFEEISLTVGISGLVLYMLFIIYKLGQESGAGKFGYFVLFFALGLGFVSLIAKVVIVEVMQI
jgi:hypothetical protein